MAKLVPKDPIQQQITNLGTRIKKLRKDKGFTNYEFFAYEKKIGRSQYGQYEKGVDMRLSSIIKIANAHGLSLKEFFSNGFE